MTQADLDLMTVTARNFYLAVGPGYRVVTDVSEHFAAKPMNQASIGLYQEHGGYPVTDGGHLTHVESWVTFRGEDIPSIVAKVEAWLAVGRSLAA